MYTTNSVQTGPSVLVTVGIGKICALKNVEVRFHDKNIVMLKWNLHFYVQQNAGLKLFFQRRKFITNGIELSY